MGVHHFDQKPNVKSSSEELIEKILNEYLKDYPLNIHNCEDIKKVVDNMLRGYIKGQDYLIKSTADSLRDTVKSACDLLESRIEKLEEIVKKLN